MMQTFILHGGQSPRLEPRRMIPEIVRFNPSFETRRSGAPQDEGILSAAEKHRVCLRLSAGGPHLQLKTDSKPPNCPR
jgi:hypothetical protein